MMKNILAFLLFFALCGQITAQCIVLTNCLTTAQACDNSTNNPELWNESYWFDSANNTQDLADAVVVSNLIIRDTCPGATASLRYLLFLDLDKNGSWETVIKSWEPPAPGTVNFDNWNNPNYDGGELRVFDERPIPAGDKYQFAIETTTNGDTTRAYLRWNTPNQPNTFVNVELPYATQKIKWLAEDTFGNNSACEYPIVVKDCQSPKVICINGLSVNILPSGHVTLNKADFLYYTEDNCTPSNLIESGIRKCGTGYNFPQDPNGDPIPGVTFTCSELGTQCVELWVRDDSGNADYCETYVIVQDNLGNCAPNMNNIAPTVVCINGLTANISATEQVDLWVADFLQYAEDDLTPAGQLAFSIRKCGTGSIFPVDMNGEPIEKLSFNCNELGTQCVELWARDVDGNADYCETYVIVQDNAGNCGNGSGDPSAPKIVCRNGLVANLMPNGEVELGTSDFLLYAVDDVTPANLLEFGIRKCGTGTGFPVGGSGNGNPDVSFDCIQLGTQCVELWARDQDGHADYCETYVIIQDNTGICPNFSAHITTCVTSHCNDSPVHGALLSANQCSLGAIGPLDPGGCAFFPTNSFIVGNINITPTNTLFPLNGVTVFDLIKIKRFILGLDTDLSPYEIIAADVNKSGTVTGFDLIELRKLLLGSISSFPTNKSWRFVDANFVFPNPNNPFQTVFPEFANIPNAQIDSSYQVRFTAIKIGDLDCDAWPGLEGPSKDRGTPQRYLNLPDLSLMQGETTELSLQMTEAGNWEGLQIRLDFDPEKIELLEVHTGNLPGMDADAFYQPQAGALNMVWMNDQATPIVPDQDLLVLRVRAKEALRVSDIFKASSDFENLGSLQDEPQILGLEFRQNVDASLQTETMILNPQPNPTSAGASIPVRLVQSEIVRVELCDLSGKVMWSNEQTLDAGSHLLNIVPQAMNQPGVYVWRVSVGSKMAAGKLVKI